MFDDSSYLNGWTEKQSFFYVFLFLLFLSLWKCFGSEKWQQFTKYDIFHSLSGWRIQIEKKNPTLDILKSMFRGITLFVYFCHDFGCVTTTNCLWTLPTRLVHLLKKIKKKKRNFKQNMNISCYIRPMIEHSGLLHISPNEI